MWVGGCERESARERERERKRESGRVNVEERERQTELTEELISTVSGDINHDDKHHLLRVHLA